MKRVKYSFTTHNTLIHSLRYWSEVDGIIERRKAQSYYIMDTRWKSFHSSRHRKIFDYYFAIVFNKAQFQPFPSQGERMILKIDVNWCLTCNLFFFVFGRWRLSTLISLHAKLEHWGFSKLPPKKDCRMGTSMSLIHAVSIVRHSCIKMWTIGRTLYHLLAVIHTKRMHYPLEIPRG